MAKSEISLRRYELDLQIISTKPFPIRYILGHVQKPSGKYPSVHIIAKKTSVIYQKGLLS